MIIQRCLSCGRTGHSACGTTSTGNPLLNDSQASIVLSDAECSALMSKETFVIGLARPFCPTCATLKSDASICSDHQEPIACQNLAFLNNFCPYCHNHGVIVVYKGLAKTFDRCHFCKIAVYNDKLDLVCHASSTSPLMKGSNTYTKITSENPDVGAPSCLFVSNNKMYEHVDNHQPAYDLTSYFSHYSSIDSLVGLYAFMLVKHPIV